MDTLSFPLSIILQNSLITGVVPEYWKYAIVKPVFKKGNRSSLDNYRPVSLTCSSSKIAEKVIMRQMIDYLESNNLLAQNQAGFREKRSTTTQMCETVSKMNYLLQTQKGLACIYFDFKKAFDSIDHRLLSFKLNSFGFGKGIVRWITEFLHGRVQKVCVDSQYSERRNVTSGVPQGSCIGPLLFILYINDIAKDLPTSVHAGLYADDLKLYTAKCNSRTLQESIEIVSRWSSCWNMQFSVQKCVHVRIGSHTKKNDYFLNGQMLNSDDLVRDLGIIMNSKFSFDEHIRKMISNSKSRMNNILRCFKCTDIHFLRKAYTVYVRPLLESATEVWSPTQIGLIDEIERVQRTYTRRIFARAGIPPATYPERLKFLDIESLHYRRSIRDISLIYKSMNGIVSFDTGFCYKPAPLTRNLRNTHGQRIGLAFDITASKRSTFVSRAINTWNNLPAVTVGSLTVESFQKNLERLNLNCFPNKYYDY